MLAVEVPSISLLGSRAGHPMAGKGFCSACRDSKLLPEQHQHAGCTAATGASFSRCKKVTLCPGLCACGRKTMPLSAGN